MLKQVSRPTGRKCLLYYSNKLILHFSCLSPSDQIKGVIYLYCIPHQYRHGRVRPLEHSERVITLSRIKYESNEEEKMKNEHSAHPEWWGRLRYGPEYRYMLTVDGKHTRKT